MIYDAFIVTRYDLDALAARFEKYRDIPDVTHVICEVRGNTPFWDNREGQFAWLLGRYTHVMVEEDELPEDPSLHEGAMKDFLLHGMSDVKDDDIILHREL